MNNIIRAQDVLLGKNKRYLGALLIALCTILAGVLNIEGLEIKGLKYIEVSHLVVASGYVLCFVGIFACCILTIGYTSRVQMYEIMAGYSPREVLFGKAFFVIKWLCSLFLIPMSVVCLIGDQSPEMLTVIMIYWVLCIRFSLVCIFLSPLLKKESFVCIFSVMVMMFSENPAAIQHSFISWFSFAQCLLLTMDITSDLVVKVLVSGVGAVSLAYVIGYVVLKNKINLYLMS